MSTRAWIALLAILLPLALLVGAYLDEIAWRRSRRPAPRPPAQPTRRSPAMTTPEESMTCTTVSTQDEMDAALREHPSGCATSSGSSAKPDIFSATYEPTDEEA